MTFQLSVYGAAIEHSGCTKCGANKGDLCRTLSTDKVAAFPHACRIGGTNAPARHPAEVTSARLAKAAEVWADKFSGAELAMLNRVRCKLEEIASER